MPSPHKPGTRFRSNCRPNHIFTVREYSDIVDGYHGRFGDGAGYHFLMRTTLNRFYEPIDEPEACTCEHPCSCTQERRERAKDAALTAARQRIDELAAERDEMRAKLRGSDGWLNTWRGIAHRQTATNDILTRRLDKLEAELRATAEARDISQAERDESMERENKLERQVVNLKWENNAASRKLDDLGVAKTSNDGPVLSLAGRIARLGEDADSWARTWEAEHTHRREVASKNLDLQARNQELVWENGTAANTLDALRAPRYNNYAQEIPLHGRIDLVVRARQSHLDAALHRNEVFRSRIKSLERSLAAVASTDGRSISNRLTGAIEAHRDHPGTIKRAHDMELYRALEDDDA